MTLPSLQALNQPPHRGNLHGVGRGEAATVVLKGDAIVTSPLRAQVGL
jgi:hypothetical protein